MKNILIAAAVVGILSADLSLAQEFPNRPIRILTGVAGGSSDYVARIIAQGISGPLGQPVVVENRASTLVGGIVAKALPDGYTMLLSGGTFAFGPLFQETPYDPVKDFTPVSLVGSSPTVLVVNISLPATSVKELIALAKAKPGQLNYGSGGTGGILHLSAELFKVMAGISIVRVPYKGTAPALLDVIAGQLQLSFPTPGQAIVHVKAGKLRALGVTSAKPSALAPGLIPIAELGLPGYESVSSDFFLAPAKTPAPVIRRLNQEIARVLNQSEVREKFLSAGIEATPSTPEQLGARIKAEIASVAKLIKDAGIKAE